MDNLVPNFKVQKIFNVLLLRVRLAAILDVHTPALRTKVSVKERLLNGTIRYLPSQQDLEYRKRFNVLAYTVTAWARWDLRRFSSPLSSSNPAWKPRIGFALGVGSEGHPVLSLGGGLRAAGALLTGRPITYSFKRSLGLEEGLKLKAYCAVVFPNYRRLGEGLGGADDEDDEYINRSLEVLLAVLAHAHSTESEEVMGLLLGDVMDDVSSGGGAVCRVALAFPQIRTDRRKDRVETSPEQMARCSAHAERLSRETGLRTRVVGWYHSHPHITVLPSHVDVRTQGMYQLLDPGFVGLIVSTFNRDAASQACTVQLTAFQSLPDGMGATGVGAPGGGSEPMAPLVRKEIRVSIVPSATSLEKSFSDLLVVQRILLMEEKEVYKKALALAAATAAAAGGGSSATTAAASNTLSGPSRELAEVHHAGVYQAHMVRLVETSLRPALMSMSALVSQQRVQERQLREQVAQLEAMVAGAAVEKAAAMIATPSAGQQL